VKLIQLLHLRSYFNLTFFHHIMQIKHTILVASLLAALSAQAQTSVTVYGNADIAVNNSVANTSAGVKTEESNIVTGGLSTSNIGFRGDREIATGLKATFQFEFEVDQSSDTGIAKTRAGIVGLAGEFGAFTFGRRTTLLKVAIDALDAGDGINTAGFIGDNARDSRRNDMLTYTTPSFSGFTADVQLGLGNTSAANRITSAAGVVTQDGKAEDSESIGLTYTNGPVSVRWATETIKNYSKTVKVGGDFGYTVANPTAIASRKNEAFGATYDFGVAKVFFVDTKMSQGTADTLVTFDTQNLGVLAPIGDYRVLVSAGKGKAKLTNSTIKADVEAMQIALMYPIVKDTTAYIAYGTESIAHPSFVKTVEQKNTQIGLRYKF
jgi:predicted porin